jgi:hypothetical protein
MNGAEKITVATVTVAPSPYIVTFSKTVGNYKKALFASILTPGIEQPIAAANFNNRARGVAVTMKVDPDDESSKFATGDSAEDQAIMGARMGEISFQQKLALPLSQGTGLALTIVGTDLSGVTIESGHAGVNYKVGDLLLAVGGIGAGGLVKVSTVSAGGVVTAITEVSAGSGYTPGNLTTVPAYDFPVWDGFIRACGHKRVMYPIPGTILAPAYTMQCGKGIGYQDNNIADEITMTMHIVHIQGGAAPVGIGRKFVGCRGDGDWSVAGVGKPYIAAYKFQGKYVKDFSVTNAQISSGGVYQLTNAEQGQPEVMLNNQVFTQSMSAGAAVVASIIQFSTRLWKMAFGGKVVPLVNQGDWSGTGYGYFITAGNPSSRQPRFTFNPLLKPISVEDIFTNVTGQQLVEVVSASAFSSPHITVTIPNSQLMLPAEEQNEGQLGTNRTCRCLRNDLVGGSPADSALPSNGTYEILLGSRT